MRKILLLSTASLVSLSTSALAQNAPMPLPPSATEGVMATPLPIQAANNSNNRSVEPLPNGVSNPAPGTIVIHFNGRVEFSAVAESSSLNTFRAPGTASAQKLDPFSTQGFA